MELDRRMAASVFEKLAFLLTPPPDRYYYEGLYTILKYHKFET